MQDRPLRPFEQGAHLHLLEWAHDTARTRFQTAGAVQVKAASDAVAAAPLDARPPRLPALEAALHGELQRLYRLGERTVGSELHHQAQQQALPVGLDPDTLQLATTAPPGEPSSLAHRAVLAAQDVAHRIHQAIIRGRLQGISEPTQLQQLGVDAGAGALKAAASSHAGGAINLGRRRAAARAGVVGARYTSVLDSNSCQPCIEADTGQLLALTDPGLIHPPNPACLGGDRCRCILVYQLETEAPSAELPVAAGR